MNIESIVDRIKQIELIAGTQATLVQRAGASTTHTEMVLNEIADRCKEIRSPNRIIDDPLDSEDRRFFEGTDAFCEATTFETYAIWQRMCNDPDGPKLSWEREIGKGITIGYLDDRPVHVSFFPAKVGGYKIMFVNITSTVADHDMLRNWLKAVMPEGIPTKIGDANNFTNCLPEGWRNAT